jgi:hypothetical protein
MRGLRLASEAEVMRTFGVSATIEQWGCF